MNKQLIRDGLGLKSKQIYITFVLISMISFVSLEAWARPSIRTVTQSEDDATVTLTLESQFVNEDSNIPCEVSVSILAEDVAFTEGDSITVSVKEEEWMEVGSWVYENFDVASGVSFLPFSDRALAPSPLAGTASRLSIRR